MSAAGCDSFLPGTVEEAMTERAERRTKRRRWPWVILFTVLLLAVDHSLGDSAH